MVLNAKKFHCNCKRYNFDLNISVHEIPSCAHVKVDSGLLALVLSKHFLCKFVVIVHALLWRKCVYCCCMRTVCEILIANFNSMIKWIETCWLQCTPCAWNIPVSRYLHRILDRWENHLHHSLDVERENVPVQLTNGFVDLVESIFLLFTTTRQLTVRSRSNLLVPLTQK